MIRLNILVEGQTEESFVNHVIGLHLAHFDIVTAARCVQTGRKRGRVFRGGVTTYAKFRNDLCNWIKEDRTAKYTMMLDYYALPLDFPGMAETSSIADPYDKVRHIENSIAQDIAAELGQASFRPYIQLHEFEALLLTNPSLFEAYYIDHEREIAELTDLVKEYDSPELINNGAQTAPSKRIINLIPTYNKTVAGPLIAERIGVETFRAKCPHFSEWLASLERLATGDE